MFELINNYENKDIKFELNRYYENKDIIGTYMKVEKILRQDEIMSTIEVTWYTGAKTFEQTLSIRQEHYPDWSLMNDRKRWSKEDLYFGKD